MVRKRTLSFFLTILLVSCTIFLITNIRAQDVGPNVDVIVTYTNADGFTIIAKDGQQVTGDLLITIYVSEPTLIHVTATVGSEKLLDEKETTDFKLEIPLKVPESKYNYILTITIEATKGAITKTIVKSFTVVKKPMPPRATISNLLSPSQVLEIIRETKWKTIMFSAIFAILGIISAVLMKYKMMILEPINIYQILFLGAASTAAIMLDPDYGIGYFMIFAVADILAYRYLEGPERISVLEFNPEKKIVWHYELPMYVHNGRLAVALQEAKWVLRRLSGQHIYLDLDDDIEFWRLNNEHSLIMAEKTDLKEIEVTEEAPAEEQTETKWAIRKRSKRREWRYVVRAFDAHKREFLRDFKVLKKVIRDAEEGWRKVKELEKTLELERIKAEAKALEELISMLRPGGEE